VFFYSVNVEFITSVISFIVLPLVYSCVHLVSVLWEFIDRFLKLLFARPGELSGLGNQGEQSAASALVGHFSRLTLLSAIEFIRRE